MNITEGLPTTNDILNVWTKQQKIDYFETILMSYNRPGMDKVIEFCRSTDFYTAPSSASYHSNYQGGLLDHSLLVYVLAMRYRDVLVTMKPELESRIPEESLSISTLLHDICKTSFYKQTVKYKKDDNGSWQPYTTYTIEDTFPIGHGEKSVIMLQNFGLELTADEMLAIRYHMGSWDGALFTNDLKYSYGKAMDMCPMMALVQSADNTSSLLFEIKNN